MRQQQHDDDDDDDDEPNDVRMPPVSPPLLPPHQSNGGTVHTRFTNTDGEGAGVFGTTTVVTNERTDKQGDGGKARYGEGRGVAAPSAPSTSAGEICMHCRKPCEGKCRTAKQARAAREGSGQPPAKKIKKEPPEETAVKQEHRNSHEEEATAASVRLAEALEEEGKQALEARDRQVEADAAMAKEEELKLKRECKRKTRSGNQPLQPSNEEQGADHRSSGGKPAQGDFVPNSAIFDDIDDLLKKGASILRRQRSARINQEAR